ncbi:Predicted arabinose efflux permease, MFS family [Friedmanniella luteola]|uniref:Predicted arabinose efflux permease, MFS family n=1 Tax=Friedmanniella luteola TaxID=546871 RepID=A0A1H1Y718_9ACTN|nr:MFS transporter [Friedmanniella luteola]SDT17175.1 Predicted arabinose efflux permease, MFS family [Friedmanniella luteola]
MSGPDRPPQRPPVGHAPPETVSWRSLAVPAYGPTVLVSIGQGAILPLVALSARDLGASVTVAALVVALAGIGQLLGDLPAGALAARVGEQRALIGACALDAVALVGAFLARSLVLLALAVLVTGLAGAVFSLARQAYLTEVVPVRMRARALSTLGGTFRIGLFIGPFIGAALVTAFDIRAGYGFAALMSLSAAVLTAFLPDVTRASRTERAAAGLGHRSVWSVLAEYRRVLLTLGLGVMVISAARSTRQSIVPLWAESQGLDAATTSIIYGVSAGVDMLLFYPGGAIMDRFGRVFVAVPSMLVLGLGFLLLPLTSTAVGIGAVACLMGLGNGISAGIVMTLGADASPAGHQSQFLGGWRLCADLGNASGPLLISAVSLVAPLAVATMAMGALTVVGSGWLARWVPAYAAGPGAGRRGRGGRRPPAP